MSKRQERADTLMRVLTRQARAVSLDQAKRIVRSVYGNNVSIASTVRWLIDQGLINTTAIAVAYPQVRQRLLLWHRQKKTPHHGRTCWLLEKRWADLTPENTRIFWATSKAERCYGGVAGLLNHSGQLEHDLGTAEVLTVAYEKRRQWANDWIGEDLLKREYPELTKRLRALPDAVTLDANGEIFKAIEFGGQYSVDRLRRLHESFSRQRIRYEIW